LNANEQNAQEKKCVGQVSNTTSGISGAWGGLYPSPSPNVCPGCGRCRDCGRPAEVQPIYPGGPIQVPYTPYVPPITSPNWTGQASSPPIGGSTLCQSNTLDSAAQDH
jgi:hypothetical protein